MTRPLTAVIAEAGDRLTRAVNAKVIPFHYIRLASDLHRAAHQIDEHMRDEMDAMYTPVANPGGLSSGARAPGYPPQGSDKGELLDVERLARSVHVALGHHANDDVTECVAGFLDHRYARAIAAEYNRLGPAVTSPCPPHVWERSGPEETDWRCHPCGLDWGRGDPWK